MKPAPFEYRVPETVADVVSLLAEHGDDAKVIAGGQSLVPMLNIRLTRFGHLVDLGRVVELRGIARDDGHVVVQAMTRQAVAERDPQVASVPLLARAIPFIGHFQIRNRGTVGGSIAHADPASELPAVALALDAELDVARVGGARRVPASEFFVGTWATSLDEQDLLAAVRFPVWEGRVGFAVDEVARRAGDFALAGVACALAVGSGGAVERAAISFFGMAPTPVRAPSAEAALLGTTPSAADLDEIGRLAAGDCDPPSDIHAPAAYRTHVGARLATRALARALDEATNA